MAGPVEPIQGGGSRLAGQVKTPATGWEPQPVLMNNDLIRLVTVPAYWPSISTS